MLFGTNPLSKWFLKLCIFSQTHSAQEKNFNKKNAYLVKLLHHKKKTSTKKILARATAERVFVILNVR